MLCLVRWSIQSSVSQPVIKPVCSLARQWVSESASESVSESVSQSVSQWVSQPVSQSASESVSQSVRQWVSESVSQWVSQWVTQWVSQCSVLIVAGFLFQCVCTLCHFWLEEMYTLHQIERLCAEYSVSLSWHFIMSIMELLNWDGIVSNGVQAWNLSILCSCNLHVMPFFCRYVKARVLVALADGTVAIFHRASGEFKFPSPFWVRFV